jgi:hypothetical protein
MSTFSNWLMATSMSDQPMIFAAESIAMGVAKSHPPKHICPLP